jgi:hypothetical protein
MADGADNSGHDSRGRFLPGNRGGPGGARRRADEFRRAAEEAVSPEHVAALMRRLTRMSLEGNLAAARLVLDRTLGRAAEAPIAVEPLGLELPRMRTIGDCSLALERITDAICSGTIDRDTARLLIDAIQARIKAIDAIELEERLAKLEEAAKTVDHGGIARGRRPWKA